MRYAQRQAIFGLSKIGPKASAMDSKNIAALSAAEFSGKAKLVAGNGPSLPATAPNRGLPGGKVLQPVAQRGPRPQFNSATITDTTPAVRAWCPGNVHYSVAGTAGVRSGLGGSRSIRPRCGSKCPAPSGRSSRNHWAPALAPCPCPADCRGFGGNTRVGCRKGRSGCR